MNIPTTMLMEAKYLNIQAKIIDMHVSGYTMEEIASCVSETPYYVNSVLLKNSEYIEEYNKGEFNQFRKLYDSGKTLEEIGAILSIERVQLRLYRNQYIITLYTDSSISCEEIADMLKCPLSDIVNIIMKSLQEPIPMIYKEPKKDTVEEKLDKIIEMLSVLISNKEN